MAPIGLLKGVGIYICFLCIYHNFGGLGGDIKVWRSISEHGVRPGTSFGGLPSECIIGAAWGIVLRGFKDILCTVTFCHIWHVFYSVLYCALCDLLFSVVDMSLIVQSKVEDAIVFPFSFPLEGSILLFFPSFLSFFASCFYSYFPSRFIPLSSSYKQSM